MRGYINACFYSWSRPVHTSPKTKISTRNEPYDQPGALMLKTIELIREHGVLEVHIKTTVPFFWLSKFIGMEFKNPSVNRIQYIYETLTNKTLV